MGRVEDATQHVPVMQRDIAEIKQDVLDVKDDTKSVRRALYTTALSIMGGSVIFAFSVFELVR